MATHNIPGAIRDVLALRCGENEDPSASEPSESLEIIITPNDDIALPIRRRQRSPRRHRAGALQNIMRVLEDIKDTLGKLNTLWWMSNNADQIRLKRKELFATRRDHSEEYRTDHRKFDQQLEGDRASPAFVPATQLDFITLTLEILARDPFTDISTSQREVLWVAYEEVAFTHAG
ncbi:hypothetical protein EDB83DRAFT_2319086 [Lactarius deliciosus]|nr:hypothetical protein EDB83DRAFT_2319086 [Lactarius deliciosus]